MLAAVVAFVVLVAVTPAGAWGSFAANATVLLLVCGVGRIGPRRFLRQMRLLAPFLLSFVLLALFAGGERVRPFGDLAGLSWVSASSEGSLAAGTLACRAVLGATAGLLLVETLGHMGLLAALRRVRLPGLIVELIGFVLRYSGLLADWFGRRSIAMASRGYRPRRLTDLPPLAASTGTLFVRSFEQGERIDAAMRARGYDGSVPAALGDLPTQHRPGSSAARRMAFVLPLVAGVGAVLG